MQKKIILVRHGETHANLNKLWQGGDLDSKLTTTGKKQALTCGKFLKKNFKISKVLCSTMTRTRQTAEIIAKMNKLNPEKFKYMDLLRETTVGPVLSGTTRGNLENIPKHGKALMKHEKDMRKTKGTFEGLVNESKWLAHQDKFFKISGGETHADCAARARKIIKILKSHKGGNLLVVMHGYLIRVVIAEMYNLNLDQVPSCFGTAKNCSITVIDQTTHKLELSQYTKYLDSEKKEISGGMAEEIVKD
jgi:broad specificity phosphatase PhoE